MFRPEELNGIWEISCDKRVISAAADINNIFCQCVNALIKQMMIINRSCGDQIICGANSQNHTNIAKKLRTSY